MVKKFSKYKITWRAKLDKAESWSIDQSEIVPNDIIQSTNSDNGKSGSCVSFNAITPFPICFNFEQVIFESAALLLFEFEPNIWITIFFIYNDIKFFIGFWSVLFNPIWHNWYVEFLVDGSLINIWFSSWPPLLAHFIKNKNLI